MIDYRGGWNEAPCSSRPSACGRWLTSMARRFRPLLTQGAEQLLRRVRAWLEREGGAATFPDVARAEQGAPDGSYGALAVFVS
jgi:hypothetical protein